LGRLIIYKAREDEYLLISSSLVFVEEYISMKECWVLKAINLEGNLYQEVEYHKY
jgi:hypothetical protein